MLVEICVVIAYSSHENRKNSFREVLIKNVDFSIFLPNNLCSTENKIFKITKITKRDCDIFVAGFFKLNLNTVFDTPIRSSDINIYRSCDDLFEIKLEQFKICNIQHKVIALDINFETIYISVMH